MDEANEEEWKEGKAKSGRSHSKRLAPKKRGTSKHSPWELHNERRREEERQRKRDLTKLECGWDELKLEREEMAKMAQNLKEFTFKDSPTACMGEILATMQKMAMT